MSLLTRSRSEQFVVNELIRLIQQADAGNEAFGVMVASCAQMNVKTMEQFVAFLKTEEPGLGAESFYDDHWQVLAVLLERHKLVDTHFHSLAVKDYLENHNLSDGEMVVASFPECGEPTESNVQQVVQLALQAKGHERGIHVYVPQQFGGKSNPSVLVVDTDEVVREFLKARLELRGYEVHEAKDGHEAFDLHKQVKPDLVITELNLPITDGYQLIMKIRNSPSNRTNIMVLTDKRQSQDMNRAYELGAAEFMTKPFSISEIEWKTKKLCEGMGA
jgi:CheY-like chemotaxis protein